MDVHRPVASSWIPTLALACIAVLGVACGSLSISPDTARQNVPQAEAWPAGKDPVATQRPAAPQRGVVDGVRVALADIPTEWSFPERGERGGKGRIEGKYSDEDIARLTAEAYALQPSSRVQHIESTETVGGGPIPQNGFDSIEVAECCASGSLNPPDPEMSAGPQHVIAVVNAAVEIYEKDGTSVFGPTPLEVFFSSLGGGCTAFAFDPNTVYDEDAGRYMVATDGNGDDYCVAVSETSDPTGNWFFYSFPVDVNGSFFDYPHAGVGRDAIYVGANMFGPTEGRVFAFDKTAMYAGNPANFTSRNIGGFTPQPINLHGANDGTWPTSGPHYILTDNSGVSVFSLFSWEDPFGADVLIQEGTLNVGAAHGVSVGFPVSNLQMGGSSITGGDGRPLDFEYRNGSGWLTNGVSCNPGNGTVSCVQWAEVDLATASLVQAGVFGSDGEYRFYPDIAADACGGAVVGYSKSSATTFAGVSAAGRDASDPLGTMAGEALAVLGERDFLAGDRWGDYTGMTIAPDGFTFWYLGEYSKDTTTNRNWGTYIASFTLPGCGGNGLFADGFESGDTSSWQAFPAFLRR